MAEVGKRPWYLPRVRSYERVGLGFLVVAAATIGLGIFRDPNVTVYGVLGVLLAVGAFIGLAVPTKKDAFASAFLAGLGGLSLGFFVFVLLAYVFTQAISLLGFVLALGVGFALGCVFGLVAGVFCGLGALLGSAFSKRRAKSGLTGQDDANGQP